MPLVRRALRDLIGINTLLQRESSPANRYRELRRWLALLADRVVTVHLVTRATVAQYLIGGEEFVRQDERLLQLQTRLQVVALPRGRDDGGAKRGGRQRRHQRYRGVSRLMDHRVLARQNIPVEDRVGVPDRRDIVTTCVGARLVKARANVVRRIRQIVLLRAAVHHLTVGRYALVDRVIRVRRRDRRVQAAHVTGTRDHPFLDIDVGRVVYLDIRTLVSDAEDAGERASPRVEVGGLVRVVLRLIVQ